MCMCMDRTSSHSTTMMVWPRMAPSRKCGQSIADAPLAALSSLNGLHSRKNLLHGGTQLRHLLLEHPNLFARAAGSLTAGLLILSNQGIHLGNLSVLLATNHGDLIFEKLQVEN